MSDYKSAQSIVVLKASYKSPISVNIFKAMRQNTAAIPELSGLSTSDLAMHSMGTDMNDENIKYKANPPTSTRALLNVKVNIFCAAYNANAFQVQIAARNLVLATGDVNLGVNLVQNAGYYLKKLPSATNKEFCVEPIGGGQVWVRTKAVAHHAGYIHQFGITTAKGIPPQQMMELLFNIESEFILENLKVAGIYGIREASILPISRKPDSYASTTNVEKKATTTVTNKTHKRILKAMYDSGYSNYKFGDWIYFVVL